MMKKKKKTKKKTTAKKSKKTQIDARDQDKFIDYLMSTGKYRAALVMTVDANNQENPGQVVMIGRGHRSDYRNMSSTLSSQVTIEQMEFQETVEFIRDK